MTDTTGDESADFEVSGPILQMDLFQRPGPAALEGPPQAWELARVVVDHGAYILKAVNNVREGRQIRDVVTAALLRRGLVTSEGIRQLLVHSLEEPAIVLLRGLLDVEVNLKLMVQDPTDRMAKRFGAHNYLAAQRAGTGLLRNLQTHAKLREAPDVLAFNKRVSREQKEFFESAAFDDVRADVQRDQHWHGKKNIQEAYEAAGLATEYFQLYVPYNPFVHATNPEWDLAEIIDGRPAMKALNQRDPRNTLYLMAGMVSILMRIYQLYLEDRDFVGYPDNMEVRQEGSDKVFKVHALPVLQMEIASIFGPWARFRNGDDSGSVADPDHPGAPPGA